MSFFYYYYYSFLTLSSTPRALFRSYLAVGKRRIVEGKGGELAQRRYTTAAATHVVCVCVLYFSKHKEYYTNIFTSESFFASAPSPSSPPHIQQQRRRSPEIITLGRGPVVSTSRRDVDLLRHRHRRIIIRETAIPFCCNGSVAQCPLVRRKYVAEG